MPKLTDPKGSGKVFTVEVNGQLLPATSVSGGDILGLAPIRPVLSELTLQAFVTRSQKILADIAHEVANLGLNRRSTITIRVFAKDGSVSKQFVYDNCLLTSLDFPRLSAGSGEILTETATFKPEILDVS